MKKVIFLLVLLVAATQLRAQRASFVNNGPCVWLYGYIVSSFDPAFCATPQTGTNQYNCLEVGRTLTLDFSGQNCPVTGVEFYIHQYFAPLDCYGHACGTGCTGYTNSFPMSEYGYNASVYSDCTGFKGVSSVGFGSGDQPPTGPGCGGGTSPGGGGGDTGDGDSDTADSGDDPDGMPVWRVSEPYLSLWLLDQPLKYKPGIGPQVALKLAYQTREPIGGMLTNVFSVGKGWRFPWFSFISTNWANTALSPAMEVHFPGGGSTIFYGTNSGAITYQPDYLTNRKLSGDTTNGFTITYSDGRQDIYGLLVTNGSGRFLKAFMTERRSKAGNALRLIYHSYTPGTSPVIRLKEIIDGDGRTNAITYVTSNNYSTNLISQVTDPFGRSAILSYDSSGRLTKIVDAANLTNTIAYDNLVPTILTTPYGRTTFEINDSSGSFIDLSGRSIRVTEPDGSAQLFVYKDSASGVDSSYTDVPITYPFSNTFDNLDLDKRNTFYWNRQQYASLSTTVIGSLNSSDYSKARLRHWLLFGSMGDTPIIGATLSFERAPTPDGSAGQKTWYDYTGKTNSQYQGTQSAPLFVATVLPGGGTNFTRTLRNSFGTITNHVETYSVGSTVYLRTNIFKFDSNEIDLLIVTNAIGVQVSSNSYNAYHQVITNYNALNETTIRIFDSNRRLSSVTLPSGLIITNIYVNSGVDSNRLQSRIEFEAGPIWYRTNSYTYSNTLVYSHTDPRGLTVTNYWDGLQRLTGTSCSEGTTSNKYHRLDGTAYANSTGGTNILDVTASKDRMGFWTYFGYDSLRRLTTTTNTLGTVSRYGYCSCGSLQSITNAYGAPIQQVTQNTFDLQGNLTNSVGADGYTINYMYNSLGQLTKVSDAVGSTTNTYNNQGLLVASSNAFGQVSAVIYDLLDRATNSTDPNGVTIVSTYDNLNRPITRTYPDNGVEKFGYSAKGLTAYTNQLGFTNRYFYDALSRKTFETNANGEIIQFQYSPASDLKVLLDGKNQTTTWSFDPYGRVTNKADNLGTNLFSYIYDPNYRLTNRTSAGKGTTVYKYDPAGNLTNIIYPVSSNITLSYDALSRITGMVDGIGTTAYSYDGANQLLTEDGPWSSDTVTYAYANRLRTGVSLEAPNISPWTQLYGYDAARRLTNVTSGAGSFGYVYNAPRSLLPIKLSLPPGAYITNTYDSNARLLSTVLKNSGNSTLNSHSNIYNLGNQRTQHVFTAGNYVNYTYDNAGQVVAARGLESGGTTNRWNQQFGYFHDAAGNLNRRTNNALIQTFNVNSLNELTTASRSGTMTVAGTTTSLATNVTVNTSNAFLYADSTFASTNHTLIDGNNTFTAIAKDSSGRSDTNSSGFYLPSSISFAYDLNGNLLTNGTRFFEYDDENQLIRITEPSAWKSEFDYDGRLHRRVRREYAWLAGVWVKTNEIRYVYDRNLVIQERDANNSAAVIYTRGTDQSGAFQDAGGIGGVLARTDASLFALNASGFAHAYYSSDGSGNIICLIDTNQAPLARYSYDVFGNVINQSGPLAAVNLYCFSSKEIDPKSGYYYFLYRFYDPSLQRWFNRDPIEEQGGMNVYSYVLNDPVNGLDPFGLQTKPTIMWPPPDPWAKHPASLDKDKGVQNTSGNAPVAYPTSTLKLPVCVNLGEQRITKPSAPTGGYCPCSNRPIKCFSYEKCENVPISQGLNGTIMGLRWVTYTRCTKCPEY